MEAKFSEFSYGFAATSELANQLKPLGAAPIFPSLVAEAKLAWDVKMQTRPGLALFVQFKLPRALTIASAREWPVYKALYYRLYVRRRRHSSQHNLLRKLSKKEPFVYYLGARFHELQQFNNNYLSSQVLKNSIAIPLRVLPDLKDNDQHYVSYQSISNAYWCSKEPQPVLAESGEVLAHSISSALNTSNPTPLSDNRLRTIREHILATLEETHLSAEFRARTNDMRQVVDDIQFLSRTFLSAEALFVTRLE
jgi:hypothetical protein